MVLGKKRWLFSIGTGAEIRPLEQGRKRPVCSGYIATIWTQIRVLSGFILFAGKTAAMIKMVWSVFGYMQETF